MSTRQLVSPSRTSPKVSTFRLQPPPYRYKEKRKGRILSKKDVHAETSTAYDDDHQPLLGGSSVASFVIGEDDSDSSSPPFEPRRTTLSRIEECFTDDGITFDKVHHKRLLAEGWSNYNGLNATEHGGVLTSPVKSDVRSHAFQRQDEPTSGSIDIENDNVPPTSTTSSFSGISRTTFGVTIRKRSSQQSMRSPDHKGEEGYLRPSKVSRRGNEEHIIVNVLPMSPMTPKRSAALHTPSQSRFDEFKINTHLVLPSRKSDLEPLSATLRRLGASRKTLLVVGGEEELAFDEEEVQRIMPEWEKRMVERLESRNTAAELMEANQWALQQSDGLFQSKQSASLQLPEDMTSKGRSLSPFREEHPDPVQRKTVYSQIQSTTRGGPYRTTMRSTMARVSMFLGNLVPTWQVKEPRDDNRMTTIKGDDHLSRPDAAAPKGKGDGWGGLRPRSSWFPDMHFGPLKSPTASVPAYSTHLRPLRLQSFYTHIKDEEDSWIDEEYEDQEATEQKPSMEAQEVPIKKLRVKFPSYLPKPGRDRRTSQDATEDAMVVEYTDIALAYCSIHCIRHACYYGYYIGSSCHLCTSSRICSLSYFAI
jgi:hypothetical protein